MLPLTLTVAAVLLLYAVGVRRLWRSAGRGRAIAPRHAACFVAGLATLAAALLSPLHHLGQQLFWAHMVQHEIVMLLAAPLIVFGRPLIAFGWALPWVAARVWRPLAPLAVMARPAPAWLIHAAVLWGWHHPVLFQATLTSHTAHHAQHASFLAAGLLFWWSLAPHRETQRRHGIAVASLFTTSLHTGLLGAALTFSPVAWYPAYGTGLGDQQLGGLIMWIPGGLVFTVMGLWLFARWIGAGRRGAMAEA